MSATRASYRKKRDMKKHMRVLPTSGKHSTRICPDCDAEAAGDGRYDDYTPTHRANVTAVTR